MLMTTNTLWTPVVSENLAALAEVSDGDTQLLVDLQPIAASVAPAFQSAIFSRLMQNLLYVSPIEYELGKAALERWFVHLFRDAKALNALSPHNDHALTTRAPHLHRKSGIPFRYMLSLQEVILKYGKRVTQNSYDPERAFSAFQKILGLEFAFNQVYEELYVSHLSELMLDD
ncbi:MAG TPA: hypothetical protein PK530_08145 [Anaerolineales bacterium]|nr:hypothetical protein [Anaerolineales bacterium]